MAYLLVGNQVSMKRGSDNKCEAYRWLRCNAGEREGEISRIRYACFVQAGREGSEGLLEGGRWRREKGRKSCIVWFGSR